MTTNTTPPVLHVPARDIPVPTSVSPEAQAVLALGLVSPPPVWPALDDPEGWRTYVAEQEKQALGLFDFTRPADGAQVEDLDGDGVRVYAVTPDGLAADDGRVYLEIHGSGFIAGGGAMCRSMAVDTARQVRATVWSVDYRMPPDHPFPAALDDCLAVYRALLRDRRPGRVIIGGPSAGGNLAAALILRARDEGLPLPAAAVLATPAVDLTGAGDSWRTNLGIDNTLTGSFEPPFALYADGHDLRDPYLSPLFGDLSRGFPPTLLLTGTRDLLLSDTVRMHRALRAAGVPADLHVFEAAGHAMFFGTAPEERERTREIRAFCERHWR
ncbi:alpha/beta hydrolase [Frankia sp. AgB1.9]|uniref:alpha/beta hydrolase n=1 Tax=unclassified Frankia TaxID=2632575 RepID=UPI00193174BF|nr:MULTISPECIES: alpha/beta hydrolase [unclassified Frankia]MBL7486862.1 alpha/beta hydrolase [Frankia sp. AgW1.1]MBL7547251.1 alpha/beta hydrolase [Frankia sp. AgB1.9]MBL7621502.1 alpha/beta hydrolase [Frankia sp. AgB1.8]